MACTHVHYVSIALKFCIHYNSQEHATTAVCEGDIVLYEVYEVYEVFKSP